MQTYFNRDIDVTTEGRIRKECDANYLPRMNFAMNRTVVDTKNKMVVQLDVNFNVCELVVPTNVETFKNVMLPYVIDFLIDSMKKMMPVRILNEIGFKLNLYVPSTSPAANETWWNRHLVKGNTVNETVFGVPLSSLSVKLSLPLLLTDSFTLQIPITSSAQADFVSAFGSPSPFGAAAPTFSQNIQPVQTFSGFQTTTPQTFAGFQTQQNPPPVQNFTQPNPPTQNFTQPNPPTQNFSDFGTATQQNTQSFSGFGASSFSGFGNSVSQPFSGFGVFNPNVTVPSTFTFGL